MVSQFTIKPGQEFAVVHRRVLERADEDPAIFHMRQRPGIDILVFAIDRENVFRLRRRFEQSGTVGERYGLIYVRAQLGELSVDPICDEDSLAQLKDFVRWVLENFGPCQVHDDERDRDITHEVVTDADFLFA